MVSTAKKLSVWLMAGSKHADASEAHPEEHTAPWWKVMCLTGVDYFSTLGYQPGIAALAAGLLSPVATLFLVLVTMLGAYPTYYIVAHESPHGQGSISMLASLFEGWRGKAIVLVLLGFAATAFIITITLSAADATAHIVENPVIPYWLHFKHKVGVTLILLATLGAIFLKGFREAIGVSFLLVVIYLSLNAWVIGVSMNHLLHNPVHLQDWVSKLRLEHSSILTMLGMSMILFPKLALGLSGFETGVAVMPLVKGDPGDDEKHPIGRIRNTRKLLCAAAAIMSIYLVTSSIVTTMLIPHPLFEEDGEANGRALAYLAHQYLGHTIGTIYDISTISILWFAGASAIAGLLTLVPKYLPKYGMAPDWAAATRPLVLFFTAVAFAVTIIFKADVDAQAGAYATGVLVLITSAAVAATLVLFKHKRPARYYFIFISCLFIYTTVANLAQRPEGLHIASFFIFAMLTTSLISRALRSTELRIKSVNLDSTAKRFLDHARNNAWGEIRILAHRQGGSDYKTKEEESRETHSIQKNEGDFIFFEVEKDDASEFIDECLDITGHEFDGYHVMRCRSNAVPNAIAALLLHIRDETGKMPHGYLGGTEGHPIGYIFKYIFLGEGETAPLAREILRSAEPDPKRRPRIHVG